MSERSVALLLTLALLLLMAAWVPFLDMIVRIHRRREQTNREEAFRRQVEEGLPRLFRFPPKANRESPTADARAR